MKKDSELFENFFQEKKDYYLEKLDFYQHGKKVTFNYTTFIFGLFWFLYRKMYLEAFIIYSFIALESIAEQLLLPQLIGYDNSLIFNIVSTVMILVIVGFTGNVLYIKKSIRLVDKAKKATQDIDEQKAWIYKKGGTSFVYIGLIVILLVLIALFKGSIS